MFLVCGDELLFLSSPHILAEDGELIGIRAGADETGTVRIPMLTNTSQNGLLRFRADVGSDGLESLVGRAQRIQDTQAVELCWNDDGGTHGSSVVTSPKLGQWRWRQW